MIKINSFGVIGGDKRQVAMIDAIAQDGYTVYAAGFEKAEFAGGVEKVGWQEAVEKGDYVILPLPATRDAKTLNAPFSAARIPLDDDFAASMQEKTVFCGMKGKLVPTSDLWGKVDLRDYFEREEFAVRYAVPTAEGAIEIAMREFPGTINGARCLVTGFGRIGKVLAVMLRGLGADVTVSARKAQDLAWIELFGCRAVQTARLADHSGFDLIFNTIPQMVFDAHVLAKTAPGAIVIDLASAPGGVDFDSAQRLGIRSIQALSLPGKVAPKAAGEIIRTTIYNMIEEG